MQRTLPFLCLAAACGGSSSSIQGAGFSPNASLAVQFVLPDGGFAPPFVDIVLSSSSPAFSCAALDAGLPTTGVVQGEVDILIAQAPGLVAGTFSVTDPDTFDQLTSFPTTGIAAIGVSGATSPPSNNDQQVQSSVSGIVTLTHVGDPWSGNFTATMALPDGGQGVLSGSFDTGVTCGTPLP